MILPKLSIRSRDNSERKLNHIHQLISINVITVAANHCGDFLISVNSLNPNITKKAAPAIKHSTFYYFEVRTNQKIIVKCLK